MNSFWRLFTLAFIAAVLSGCSYTAEINPVTTMTRTEAAADTDRMRADPVPLDRPVLVLNGYRGPAWLIRPFVRDLAEMTSGDTRDWLGVSYSGAGSIRCAADSAVRAVERRWPSDDPAETIEVDVIGLSMGGLVAREAAIRPAWRSRDGKRLRIRRLFTLGTPHLGARLAEQVAPDHAARQMKPGSAYLAGLDVFLRYADYELLCYGHTNDRWVGLENSAPRGLGVIWAEGRTFMSHFMLTDNPLLVADIARRLRGERPISEPVPAPTDATPTSSLAGVQP